MRRRWVLALTLAALLVTATAPGRLVMTPWGSGNFPAQRLAGNAGAAPAAPIAGRGYQPPLSGVPTVVRPFQLPPQPWMAGHRGVDLAAPPGARVLSAGRGVVAFAGTVAGVGVVSVDHPDGLRTTYQPVTPLVRAGQAVTAGTALGVLLAGHPGCPVAACLHWGLRRGEDYLDPMSLLELGPIRLYPA